MLYLALLLPTAAAELRRGRGGPASRWRTSSPREVFRYEVQMTPVLDLRYRILSYRCRVGDVLAVLLDNLGSGRCDPELWSIWRSVADLDASAD